MDINNTNTNPIQIVAFSTNDTYQTPNDFINIFLSFQKHKILKKSHHSISFNLTIPNVSYPVKIMVYTVSKFDRSYSGLCDVNCYMIFINIDESEANKKLDDIIVLPPKYPTPVYSNILGISKVVSNSPNLIKVTNLSAGPSFKS